MYSSIRYLGAGVGDEFGGVEVVAVEGCAARVPVPPRTGAQGLGEVEPYVNGVANLLHGALGQQINVLVVRVVVVLGGLGQGGARTLRQSYSGL